MAQAKYQILEQKSFLTSTVDSDIEEELEKTLRRKSSWIYILTTLLALSVAFNLWLYSISSQEQCHYSSYVIDKENVKDVVIEHLGVTLDDPDWSDPRYDGYHGFIAVGEEFIQENNLLPSEVYPWDTSKAVYFLNGFHSIHCVNKVAWLLNQLQQGSRPSLPYFKHAAHCLRSLRADAICYADDLPLYTGSFNAEAGHRPATPGVGQIRKCRDWDRLRKFAVENSACYNPDIAPRNASTLEHYKFCPDGSKPWEKFERAS